MKRSLYLYIILIIIFFSLSCSTYSVKKDFKENSILSKVKNTGVIFRISNGSKITEEELIRNCSYWLSVYKKKGNITIITDAGNALTFFNNPQQRFYQLSNEDKYLEYKSLGVVNLYLQNNQNELLNIISKNSLDSIIIYEVYSIISTQMQFFEYESVLAIADSNLNIGYLDHQSDYFESASSSIKDLKNQTLDKINDRLIEKLRDINVLGGLTEGEKKILIKDSGKSKAGVEEKPVVKQTEKPSEKETGMPAEKPEDNVTGKSAEKQDMKPELIKPVEKSAEKQEVIPAENPKEIQKDVKPEEKQKNIKTDTKTPDKSEKKEEEVTSEQKSSQSSNEANTEVKSAETAPSSVEKPAVEK